MLGCQGRQLAAPQGSGLCVHTVAQATHAHHVETSSAAVASVGAQAAAARDAALQAAQRCQELQQQLERQQDAVKIKAAMVDSANESVAALKAEVADLSVEADDARRAAGG